MVYPQPKFPKLIFCVNPQVCIHECAPAFAFLLGSRLGHPKGLSLPEFPDWKLFATRKVLVLFNQLKCMVSL